MGCMESSEDSTEKMAALQRSKKIDKVLKLEKESKTKMMEAEILMIGARNSGKKELLKYIQILFGEPDVTKKHDEVHNNADRLYITSFAWENLHFRILDIGCRLPRNRKLFHYFEPTDAIVFVIDLCSYDKITDDVPPKNGMKEQIKLIDMVCNNRYFEEVEKILFFTNRKAFEEKLRTVPLCVCFPDIIGLQTVDDPYSYVLQEFMKLNKTDSLIYVHCIDIDNPESIRLFVAALKDSLCLRSLKRLSLV